MNLGALCLPQVASYRLSRYSTRGDSSTSLATRWNLGLGEPGWGGSCLYPRLVTAVVGTSASALTRIENFRLRHFLPHE
jgi:hypothetical protein